MVWLAEEQALGALREAWTSVSSLYIFKFELCKCPVEANSVYGAEMRGPLCCFKSTHFRIFFKIMNSIHLKLFELTLQDSISFKANIHLSAVEFITVHCLPFTDQFNSSFLKCSVSDLLV